MWVATLGEVTQATTRVLGKADLGQVMLTGWGKYRELREAGARTLGTSDTVIVDLAGRNLVLRQRPRVELSWGGQPIATLQFVVSVEIRVRAVSAVVKGGALVELTTGECLGVVSLELNGEQLAREECLLDPHLAVRLGNGVPLVGLDEDTSRGGEANPGVPGRRVGAT